MPVSGSADRRRMRRAEPYSAATAPTTARIQRVSVERLSQNPAPTNNWGPHTMTGERGVQLHHRFSRAPVAFPWGGGESRRLIETTAHTIPSRTSRFVQVGPMTDALTMAAHLRCPCTSHRLPCRYPTNGTGPVPAQRIR
jgi:hypothetical protein